MGRRRRGSGMSKWEVRIAARDRDHEAFGIWHLAFGRIGRCQVKDFRDLRVWERAHRLTLEIYRITAEFPRYELYGLTSQIRRCSASIGANIAEGCGKRGNNEFPRFLQIASGAASELDSQLLLAVIWGLFKHRNTSRWRNHCGEC